MSTQAEVRVRLEGSSDEGVLWPGDLIGRSASAALQLDDARVSEAHAMVSLRGEHLVLLALRGRLRARDRFLSEITLEAGLRVELAPGRALLVVEVHLPETATAIAWHGQPPVALRGTTSILEGPPPKLKPGHHEDALAVFWTFQDRWRVRTQDGSTSDLVPGPLLLKPGIHLEVTQLSLEEAGAPQTALDPHAPRAWTVYATHVLLTNQDAASLHFGGIPGHLLALLLQEEGAIAWRVVASVLWAPSGIAEQHLRRRLDTTVNRLRQKLRMAGVDPGRLALDGSGSLRFVVPPTEPLRFVTQDRHAHDVA